MLKLKSLLVAALWVAGVTSASAANEVFVTEAGAIRGFDPVAYHTDNKPVAGKSEISFDWSGATWHFASTAHRDLFAKDPERYAPRFGGYCAYGTSNGYKVSTQPEAFAIENGKLYLNYNTAVQTTWNGDRPGYIRKADDNWTSLHDDEYESDEATITKLKSK